MRDFYPLVEQAMRGFGPKYDVSMAAAIHQAGARDRDWITVFLANAVAPWPLAGATLRVLMPYLSPSAHRAQLEGAAARGFLESDHPGGYRLSKRGRNMLKQSYAAARQALYGFEPLPMREGERLCELLTQGVAAAWETRIPAAKTFLRGSRWADPGENAPLAARLDQLLTDLVFFRNDAHLAAWHGSGLDGYGWETLTCIWRGEATTVASIARRLGQHGCSAEDYAQALHELHTQGLIEAEGNVYRLTEQGKRLREKAEYRTDEIFFAPWLTLSETERSQLRELLLQLHRALQQSLPEQAIQAIP